MRIGITGSKGFIGSNLAKKVKDAVLYEGDLRHIKDVRSFVGKCDRIYHLAGKNREEDGGILSNNLVATGNIVLACLGTDKEVVFASSTQVMTNPESEYGFTKMMEEQLIKKLDKWCIFRIPNVYGIGARPNYNSVVATFAYKIVRSQEVTINDPEATRDFIHVDDIVYQLVTIPHMGSVIVPGSTKIAIGELYEVMKNGNHKRLKECLDYELERFKEETNEVSVT